MGKFPFLQGLVIVFYIMGGIALGVGVLALLASLASIGQLPTPGNFGAWAGFGVAGGSIAGGLSLMITAEMFRLGVSIHEQLERTANATEALAATIKKPTA